MILLSCMTMQHVNLGPWPMHHTQGPWHLQMLMNSCASQDSYEATFVPHSRG